MSLLRLHPGSSPPILWGTLERKYLEESGPSTRQIVVGVEIGVQIRVE